jgi:hypothetical protein
MAISKSQKTTAAKKKPTVNSNTQSVAPSQKRKGLRATRSKHATVEDSDEDEELGFVGGTLSPDEDAIMEEVDAGSERTSRGSTSEPIELTDAEDEEEDEEGEISELLEYCLSYESQHITRTTGQRLDCSGLRILQAYSNRAIC